MAEREKLLWGVPETAEETDINPKTLRKMLEAGKIPGMRMGRNWKIPLWWIRAQRDGLTPTGKAA